MALNPVSIHHHDEPQLRVRGWRTGEPQDAALVNMESTALQGGH